MSSSRTSYTSQFKHHVLSTYEQSQPHPSFRSLAKQFNIKGGRRIIPLWYRQWDGTPSSLERKPVSGRPSIMSRVEIQEHIIDKVKEKNQSHTAIHYPDLLSSIKTNTNRNPSIQTVRRYGHDVGHIKMKKTSKRTEKERNFLYITYQFHRSLFRYASLAHLFCSSFFSLSFFCFM